MDNNLYSTMNLFSKIYVINLKRRNDKRRQTQEELDRVGIPKGISVEFFEAVDGNDFYQTRDGEWMDPYQEPFKLLPQWSDPASGKTLTKGEVGCALSHVKVWKEAYKNLPDGENVLILEDDVVFTDGFWDKVKQLEKELVDVDYDLLYLGRIKLNKEAIEQEVTKSTVNPLYSYWTSSILYTKKGLKKVMDHKYENRIVPADEFIPALFGMGQKNVIESLRQAPNVTALATNQNLISQRFESFSNSDTELSPPYHPEMFNPAEFVVLTVGTDYNDGLKRLETSLRRFGYPYRILGLGETWYGGDDILHNPGAGQKVNILRKELEAIVNREENPIILFLDGYDTIVLQPANQLVKVFEDSKQKIIFGAEKVCWPDRGLARQYPKVDSPWKYLNSGQFIGHAEDLLKLMNDGIDDADDDQLYYTKKFLEGEHGIALDHECRIFQCLQGSEADVRLDHGYAQLHNNVHGSMPFVAHGNGDISCKYFFNYASNFMAGNFRKNYGYLHFNEKVEIELLKTRVLVSVFDTSNNPEHIYQCLDSLRFLEYPHQRLTIAIYSYAESQRRGIARYVAQGDFAEYESIFIIHDNVEGLDDRWLRTRNLEIANGYDYNLCIDSDVYVDRRDIIQYLASYGKTIIAPYIKDNFWMTVNTPGWEKSTEETKLIKEGKYRGVWGVAKVDKLYLIDCSYLDKINTFFEDNFSHERGTNMALCYNLVAKCYVPYLINIESDYAEIIP